MIGQTPEAKPDVFSSLSAQLVAGALSNALGAAESGKSIWLESKNRIHWNRDCHPFHPLNRFVGERIYDTLRASANLRGLESLDAKKRGLGGSRHRLHYLPDACCSFPV
jgi:hypothetical protein